MPVRFSYTYNPACACAWCVNDGRNPLPPGHPDTLGYDEPHIPVPDNPSHESPFTPRGTHIRKYGP